MPNATQASQLTSNAGQDRTWKWAAKLSWGYPFNYLRNVIQHAFGYTHIGKKVSAATAAAVLSSTNGTTSQQVITSGITNPDVPRVLAVTLGGSGFSAGSVVIVGTNVEGKTITDTIAYTTSTGQVIGQLVFKTVTSITLAGSLGASATVTVDTTSRIGLVHRLSPTKATAIVIHDNNVGDRVTSGTTNLPVIEAAPSASNFDLNFVEKNWLTPATTLNGTNFLYIFYWMHQVLVQPFKDDPTWYSTTTSTSTSTSSTSTSISSTSTSISTTTSVSTSSSTSISSTSTSTTTLPF